MRRRAADGRDRDARPVPRRALPLPHPRGRDQQGADGAVPRRLAPADGARDGAAAAEGGAPPGARGRRDPPAQPRPASSRHAARPACRSTRAATASRSSCARARSTARLPRAPAHGPRGGAAARPRLLLLRRAHRLRHRGVRAAQDGDHARLRHRARAHGPVGLRAAVGRHLGPRPGPPDDARRRSPPTGSASAPTASRSARATPTPRPYGWGTFASRSMVGRRRRDPPRRPTCSPSRLKPLAAHLLEADPEDLELRDGEAVVRGAPGQERHVRRHRARSPTSRPTSSARGRRARPRVHRQLRPARDVLQRAATARSSRSTPRRWACAIERYVVVEDCGVMVNPAIVEGQVRGGVAQGDRGGALRGAGLRRGRPAPERLADGLPRADRVGDPGGRDPPPRDAVGSSRRPARRGWGRAARWARPRASPPRSSDALAHLGVEIDRIPITPDRPARGAARAGSRHERCRT